jgi:hypothetical protein
MPHKNKDLEMISEYFRFSPQFCSTGVVYPLVSARAYGLSVGHWPNSSTDDGDYSCPLISSGTLDAVAHNGRWK